MKKSPLLKGQCKKRKLEVNEYLICDWFEHKKETKDQVCCKNCKYFQNIKKSRKKNES